jgi:OmpA-OmpF porin, OOP family
MTTRDRILARRARFIAASMATLATDCGSPQKPEETHAVAPAPSASTSTSAAPSTSTAPPTPIVDTDGDGIPDPDDKCPTTAGVPSDDPYKHGCPKVVVQVCLSIMIIEVPHFAAGSAKLQDDSKKFLDAAASTIADHPEIEQVEIAGHCDAIEKPCPDEARAKAVRDALATRGVAKDRLTTRAAGRAEPAASNDTPDGRAKNRRAELKVTKKK